MKKTTKKSVTKKVAKKKLGSKPKKAKPAKFDFAKLLSIPVNGKGKVYIKILGPESWPAGKSITRDMFAEIDYAQLTKPTAADCADLYAGTCWAEYTLTKIHYAAEPEVLASDIEYGAGGIYDGGN